MVLAEGSLVAGRYRIVRELGRGGMGSVYVAEHVNTGGRWALKVMHGSDHLGADRLARFRREARASSRITSENVVRVTDADVAPELDGAPFIVMELLDGEDLDHHLAARQVLSPRETVDILLQVARGLDKAHAVGVVHRDLKPENVFLHRRDDGSTVAKVVDFGISKVLRPGDDPSLMSVTSSGELMGTPLYMAPEQARAKTEEIGPGTDVWAIGLMAYRMLTGENYWVADTIANLFFQILTEEKPAPSTKHASLPVAFDAWFAKSCSISPANRYPSVGEQIAELSRALLGQRVLPAGPTPQHISAVDIPSTTHESAVPVTMATALLTPAPGVPARLPSNDHSVAGTDISTPTASTGIVPAPSAGRRNVGIAATVAVLVAIVGFTLFRTRNADKGDTASAPLAPTSSTTAAEVPHVPTAAPEPSAPTSPATPSAVAVAPSVAPPTPSTNPKWTGPAKPRPSASHAPAEKPRDLFDTQK